MQQVYNTNIVYMNICQKTMELPLNLSANIQDAKNLAQKLHPHTMQHLPLPLTALTHPSDSFALFVR